MGVYSENSQGLPELGFLYSDGTYSTLDVPGSIATEAIGINDLGQIVGYYTDAAGNEHGFLATSTPEASTLVLAGIGLLAITGYAWWQRRALNGTSA